MTEYTDTVMDHFKNPRNVGVLDDPSGVGKVSSPVCGDLMELYIKVDSKEVITDVRFRTFGCGAAIASSSMLTELIKGKTISEAEKITNDRVVKALGGLPAPKVHCSVLAEDGLKRAIDDYKKKKEAKKEIDI